MKSRLIFFGILIGSAALWWALLRWLGLPLWAVAVMVLPAVAALTFHWERGA